MRWLDEKNEHFLLPSTDRWHSHPVSINGGIAIFLGISVALIFNITISSIGHSADFALTAKNQKLLFLLLGTAILFAVGFVDDRIQISPVSKLAWQFLTALIMVIVADYRLNCLISPFLDKTITILWIMGMVNALNLLDNMDGLAVGTALIASLYLSCIMYFFTTDTHLLPAALALAGAMAAFLYYNFKPASIFMGDSGSLPVGFLLALLTLGCSPDSAPATPLNALAPALILLTPILDTGLVITARTLGGKSIFTGGTDHISHRLVRTGLSERRAVLFLYGISIISGLCAVVTLLPNIAGLIILLFLLLFIILFTLALFLAGKISIVRRPSSWPRPQHPHNFSLLSQKEKR